MASSSSIATLAGPVTAMSPASHRRMVRSPFGPKRKASANPRWERPRDLRAVRSLAGVMCVTKVSAQPVRCGPLTATCSPQCYSRYDPDTFPLGLQTAPRRPPALGFAYPLRGRSSPRAHRSIRHSTLSFGLRVRFPLISVSFLCSPWLHTFNKDTVSGCQEVTQ